MAFARGNRHHRRVDQAQLHDSRVILSEGGRVMESDPGRVMAAWQEARGGVVQSPFLLKNGHPLNHKEGPRESSKSQLRFGHNPEPPQPIADAQQERMESC